MDISHYNTTTKQADFTSGTNLTFSHNSGGTSPYLIGVTLGYNVGGVTGLSYAGVAATKLVDYVPSGGIFGGNCLPIRVWGLSNPASGTNTVSVDYVSNSGNIVVSTYNGVGSVQGAIYSTLASIFGMNTTWTHTLGAYTGGKNWMLGLVALVDSGSSIAAGANTTLRGSTLDGGGGAFAITDNNGNNTIDTLNWDVTRLTGFWSDVVLELKAVSPTVPQMIII